MDVFFETLGHRHWPLVMWYLVRGRRIFVFDFTCNLKAMRWLRRLIDAGLVERICVNNDSPAHAAAIAAVEEAFGFFANRRTVAAYNHLFGAAEALPIFKKALLISLDRYFFIRHYFAAERDEDGVENFWLIPDTFCEWDDILRRCRGADFEPSKKVSCPRWARWFALVSGYARRVPTSLIVALATLIHLVVLAVANRWRRGVAEIAEIDHVYAVDQPFQMKFQGPRRFDFLLDGQRLSKDNTAFLVGRYAEGEWVVEAERSGYRMVRVSDFVTLLRPDRHFQVPTSSVRSRALMGVVLALATEPTGPVWMTEAALRGVDVYLTAGALLDCLRFHNYVYMNRDDLKQAWLNAAIRARGRQSWNFAFSIGAGYLTGGDSAEALHWLWCYQNADHFVGPSRRLVDYHQAHPQHVGAYHSVGNIWSERVAAAGRSSDVAALRRHWFGGRASGAKVVAWFDTTFVEAENSPIRFTDAIAWYTDIQRLMAADDRVLSVIKPSKDEAYFVDERSDAAHPLGREVLRIWEALKRDPRVRFAGHDADPATIIAASDLTVTFCFSSPSAEALGAGRPAIWYEPGDRWRAALYGTEPMLTAHGSGELQALVHRLLYEITEDEYREYLEHKLRGLVEEFFDGNGLTRFRALLADAARGRLAVA